MNFERAAQLADFIEKSKVHVQMNSWTAGVCLSNLNSIDECDTACCTAGFCALMNLDEYKVKYMNQRATGHAYDPADYAWAWLDLTYEESNALFYPEGYEDVNPADAKPRLLQLLRGEAPITNDWLIR